MVADARQLIASCADDTIRYAQGPPAAQCLRIFRSTAAPGTISTGRNFHSSLMAGPIAYQAGNVQVCQAIPGSMLTTWGCGTTTLSTSLGMHVFLPESMRKSLIRAWTLRHRYQKSFV
ncbi:hypothetical protein J3459_005923 [Metarhizium acridum]|uniref:uncharacterized protein n=1 Tax=Metarhizium acridum TaxID=92637 RepID=UPI001C6B4495|nr:hypothetical protein J3458_005834 [Metarhizium acridum]KAG8428242.1 hypothetical protein J3459_005923 [Metarhizium acridum]